MCMASCGACFGRSITTTFSKLVITTSGHYICAILDIRQMMVLPHCRSSRVYTACFVSPFRLRNGVAIFNNSEVIIQVGPKNWHTLFCTPELHQILTDFQTHFTIRIRRTFVIKQRSQHTTSVSLHYLVKYKKTRRLL